MCVLTFTGDLTKQIVRCGLENAAEDGEVARALPVPVKCVPANLKNHSCSLLGSRCCRNYYYLVFSVCERTYDNFCLVENSFWRALSVFNLKDFPFRCWRVSCQGDEGLLPSSQDQECAVWLGCTWCTLPWRHLWLPMWGWDAEIASAAAQNQENTWWFIWLGCRASSGSAVLCFALTVFRYWRSSERAFIFSSSVAQKESVACSDCWFKCAVLQPFLTNIPSAWG